MNQHVLNLIRGMAMGCADVVPGVSGGTVALIVGIYERLVTALSHFDRHWLSLIAARKWRAAARHIDLGLLLSLATGILLGFVLMTLALNRVLKHDAGRPLLFSAFFGMIVAASVLLGRMVRPTGRQQLIGALAAGSLAAAFSLTIALLRAPAPDGAISVPSPWFLFASGAIAICAMILPGISGAMILLLMGIYTYLADIPHLLLHGEQVGLCLQTIAFFGAGCAVGLLAFSKLLRWLLGQHHALTMSTLCGVMVGALPKIWPFQRDLSPQVTELKYKQFEPMLPTDVDLVLASAGVAMAAMALVFFVDYWRRQSAKSHSAAG